MDILDGADARRDRKGERYFAAGVIVILLLGFCALVLGPYLFVFYAVSVRNHRVIVAQSEAPGGDLTLSVGRRLEVLGFCYPVTAQRARHLFSTDVGSPICQGSYSHMSVDGDRQRFEWFEDRSMVALVADGERALPNGQPYNFYIRLFRYDDAGNVSELSTDDLRADPKDSPQLPVRIGDGPYFAGDYAWRDRHIRALLGLAAPASPDAADTPDAAGTPDTIGTPTPTGTPNGARP